MPSYCAPCVSEWRKKTDDERKQSAPKRPLTTVGGVPVCGDHVDAELSKVRDARRQPGVLPPGTGPR